eukprot:m.41367 g.41367  ORF g.41367 m.41367 type:complete len:75 (+) comp18786_c0_seq1:1272-1496(+)
MRTPTPAASATHTNRYLPKIPSGLLSVIFDQEYLKDLDASAGSKVCSAQSTANDNHDCANLKRIRSDQYFLPIM